MDQTHLLQAGKLVGWQPALTSPASPGMEVPNGHKERDRVGFLSETERGEEAGERQGEGGGPAVCGSVLPGPAA